MGAGGDVGATVSTATTGSVSAGSDVGATTGSVSEATVVASEVVVTSVVAGVTGTPVLDTP
jgi:hypothetical protein